RMRGYGLARRRARLGGERSRRSTNQCAGVKSFGVVDSDQRGTHDRAAHPEAHPLRRVRKIWRAGTRDFARKVREWLFTRIAVKVEGLTSWSSLRLRRGLAFSSKAPPAVQVAYFLKPMARAEQGRSAGDSNA